jgi:hypothetical protein
MIGELRTAPPPAIGWRQRHAMSPRGSGGGGGWGRERDGTRSGLVAWRPASGLPLQYHNNNTAQGLWARFTTGELLREYGMLSCVVDDKILDDDDELQSEMEAEHASTRIQQRETRGTFRMVNPRQRKTSQKQQPSKRRQPKTHSTHTVKCVRNYNTAHNTNYKTTQGPLWAPWHLRVPRYRQQWHIHATLPCTPPHSL